MKVITRKLQYATWEYDVERGEVTLTTNRPEQFTKIITLNKTYSYSLGRFLIRAWQEMSKHPKKKKIVEPIKPEKTLLPFAVPPLT